MQNDKAFPPPDELADGAIKERLEDGLDHSARRAMSTKHITAIATGAVFVLLIMVVLAR